MDKTNTKWWLDSLTIRGAMLAGAPVITSLLSLMGVKIGSDEVNSVVEGVAGFVGAIGVVITIIGRIRAEIVVRFQKN